MHVCSGACVEAWHAVNGVREWVSISARTLFAHVRIYDARLSPARGCVLCTWAPYTLTSNTRKWLISVAESASVQVQFTHVSASRVQVVSQTKQFDFSAHAQTNCNHNHSLAPWVPIALCNAKRCACSNPRKKLQGVCVNNVKNPREFHTIIYLLRAENCTHTINVVC